MEEQKKLTSAGAEDFSAVMKRLEASNAAQERYARKQYRMSQLSTVANLAVLALVVFLVATLLPKVNATFEDLNTVMKNVQTITEDLAEVDVEDGAWVNDTPYGVVHRIASAGTVKGAGFFCVQWAFRRCGNLRIDTHRDNTVMQNMLRKNGFSYCGIIHLENGDERLAFQKA